MCRTARTGRETVADRAVSRTPPVRQRPYAGPVTDHRAAGARPVPPVRLLAAAVLGTVVWPLDLVASAVAVAARAAGVTPAFPAALVRRHRRRLVRLVGWEDDGAEAGPGAAAGFLLCRVGVGILGTGVLALLGYGLFAAAAGLSSWLFDVRFTVADPLQGGQVTTASMLVIAPLGLVLLYLDLMGLAGIAFLDRAAATRWFSPDRSVLLERQVEDLTVSRAELLAALDAERSRIERDLHDGVQQRVVALGLLVGRARRHVVADGPGRELLDRAADEAEHLAADLRDVAWRVRPTTLDTHGLAPVLHQLVERTTPPARLDWPDPERLPAAVESTLYYVVAESLTNVTRHALATGVRVRVAVGPPGAPRCVTVTVADDGVGGASFRPGHGLAGLAGRVTTAGGSLAVDSPPGGGTTVRAVVPCG